LSVPTRLNSFATVVDLELDKKYWDQWAPINFSAQYDNKKISQKLKHEMLSDFEYDVDIWSNNGLGKLQ